MKEKISIPEWHAMAQAGRIVPMRIPIHGISMYPLIRMDRDMVTIMPVEERPRVGDIVLFCDPKRERYVLHRLWKAEENRAFTWGDNCENPDGWMEWDKIWGKAVLIERGKLRITPDPKKGLRLARVWHKARNPFYFCWSRFSCVKRALLRLIGRKRAG